MDEHVDWHECQDLPPSDFSRNISTCSEGPPRPQSSSVSRAASPVGSGPSQIVRSWDCTSGYRTPDRPQGFVRCFERPVVNRRQSTSSLESLSQQALLAPARELRRMSLAPIEGEKSQKELEETKSLLQKNLLELSKQTMYDQMLDKFRPFLTALSRAEQLLRREPAEQVLGLLEPKAPILHFVLELHELKRQYRRQTACCLNVLLQSKSWLRAYEEEGLLAKTPQELLLALPMLQTLPKQEKKVVSLALPVEPIPAVTSPTRRAAVEADAKVVRERRMRRATRRPDEPLEDLLQKSRDQALALDFSATADPDEVHVAFETFHRAVRHAFESEASKDRLRNFEPKSRMTQFVVDVGVKRKAWRSRVFYVLTKLHELDPWHSELVGREVQDFLAQSPSCRSPLSPHSEPEPEQSSRQVSSSPRAEDGREDWRELARQKAPWYLRMCFTLIGVDRTIRFCKCLVPRDIHQLADQSCHLKSVCDEEAQAYGSLK